MIAQQTHAADFFPGRALVEVTRQAFGYEVAGIGGQGRGQIRQVCGFDVVERFLNRSVGFEGVVSREEQMQDDSERPHIKLFAAVVGTLQLLGRHVARASYSHSREDIVAASEQPGMTEISDLELTLGVK